jgi:hypothetical protein
MRLHTAIASTLVLAGSTAGAQVVATPKAPVAARGYPAIVMDSPRAAIGVSTSFGTGSRDTLGLLVSSVTREGPAEKAGIEEGNRIATINGVSLKLAAADLGDPDMERLMGRRLTRELDKLKPGDEVNLSVYGNGQTRAIKVKTVDPDSLRELNRSIARRKWDERATLGIGLASTGSKRDTLGVFVMSVDDDGPAAKAGIEEGARISAINGVDLRVAREDAGDEYVSTTRLNRMQRELNNVKAGDAVELRVYQNGQTKTVKATAVTIGELAKTGGRKIIHGNGVTIIRSGDALSMEVDPAAIATTVRRATETAARVAGDRLEDVGRVLEEMSRGLSTTSSGTIRWMNDETTPVAKKAPARTIIRM